MTATAEAALAATLADLVRRVEAMERGSQMQRTSIEGGALVVNDEVGSPVLKIGLQPDGTFAMIGANGGRVVANDLDLPEGTITETDIADDSISTPKLRANCVTADKVNAGAVTADKIAANTITGDRIAANTITGDRIAANAITADKIAANAITADKLSATAIDGKTITGVEILSGEYWANDPDGSYVHIYPDAASGAVVDLQPANEPGSTFEPARLRTTSGEDLAGPLSQLVVVGPKTNGPFHYGSLSLLGRPNDSFATLDARQVVILCNGGGVPEGATGGSIDLGAVNENDRSTTVTRNLGKSLLPNARGTSNLNPSGNTTSAVFANAPISAFNFTKHWNDTRLKIELSTGAWRNGGALSTEVEFAIKIGAGADTVITSFLFNNAGEHLPVTKGTLYVSGLTAGSVSIQVRWRRVGGDGIITMDGADMICLDVTEVAP